MATYPSENAKNATESKTSAAGRGEILAWASYDIANSTYATVVATAIYNAYFVQHVAGKSSSTGGLDGGSATLLLTVVISVAAFLIVFTAPILGTIADATASKKRILLYSTIACVLATASLGFFGPGSWVAAAITLTISLVAFGTAEDFVAAFLPELANTEDIGWISSIGWAAGYVGGLFSLGACLAYVYWARSVHMTEPQYVPVIMLACAVFYALLAIPTFVFLKERAKPDPSLRMNEVVRVGFERLAVTVGHAKHYRDLFNFLFCLFIYACGTTTIVHVASIYAQQVLAFTTTDSLIMILVVDITAAIGAVVFGMIQRKIGSTKTLSISLGIWMVAILVAYSATTKMHLWIAANFVGVAMGATGSTGRALVAQFSPRGRSGEFLGLWGMAVKLATGVGALVFGLVTYLTASNYRLALLSTLVFFIGGWLLLLRVNETRGIEAAHTDVELEV